SAPADDGPALEFLNHWCSDCHSGTGSEGGFNLQTLTEASEASFDMPDGSHHGLPVFDRIRSCEMPPADADQPAAEARADFLEGLSEQLTAAHQRTKGTVLRRLNRQEYQNTLNDMFGTHLDLAVLLPEDARSHAFSTIG